MWASPCLFLAHRAAEEAAKYNKVNIAATDKANKFTGAPPGAQRKGGWESDSSSPATAPCRRSGAEHLEADARRCVHPHLRERDHPGRRVQGVSLGKRRPSLSAAPLTSRPPIPRQQQDPVVPGILIADMSSNFCSKPVDVSKYGVRVH